MWIWFWGICIPNSYGSGTTRARGAPLGWFAPHGDGREGVFGSLPFMARSSVRPVSGDSLARVCHSGQTSCRLMRTECRFAIRASRATPSPPHPAAPLGSVAVFRRPVSFAPYHPPFPSLPQVCGGEKRASPLQACVKCVFGVFQGGLWVALCRGCVISGNAKVQRYRQFHQCPSGWSGVLSPLRPPWATNAAAHRAAFCRLVCPVQAHSCVRLNQQTKKERNKPNETHKNPDQGKAS